MIKTYIGGPNTQALEQVKCLGARGRTFSVPTLCHLNPVFELHPASDRIRRGNVENALTLQGTNAKWDEQSDDAR